MLAEYWAIVVALLLVGLAIYYYHVRENNVFKRHGVPHLKPVPFLGNAWRAVFRMTSFADLTLEIYNVHKTAKYIGMFDFDSPVIVLRDPELLKTVIVKNFDHFPEHRAFSDDSIDPLFSKNLFSLRGERWKEVRNLTTPVFTTSKMRAMFKLMVSVGDEFMAFLSQMPESPKGIDTKDAFTRYTNDVIASCAFGISVNSMKDRNNQVYVYGREATNFAGVKALVFFLIRSMPWLAKALGITLVRREVSDFFKQLVNDTMKAREEQGIVRPDVIQQLMENREKANLSLDDVTAQAFIFFIGGFESTSTTMCFAAQEIAMNREVHEKLQSEVDSVLEETNGEITYEVLNNMKYLDAVVNETLRMYPMSVITDRRCTKAYELPPAMPGAKPYVVPEGSYVWYAIYGMQRDPEYFEDPHTFNPDRFIENPQLVNCGAYVPFGLGPRMCIGNRFALLEVKVLLFHLLAYCDIKPCAKTKPIRISRKAITLTVEDGFWLGVHPRSKPHPSIAARFAKDAKA